MHIEQRLFSRPIPRHEQLPPPSIVQCKGEHAIQARETLGAPFPVGGQQHFGIALRAEGVASGCQFAAQIGKVVNFTIEDDAQLAAGVQHGLMTGGGKVNDRQAALP